MSIIVVDPDHPDQEHRRDWTSLLGKQVQTVSVFPQSIDSSSIVFIHAQFANAEISVFSETNAASVCVVISGGAKPVDWIDSPHCYWRIAPVAKPADSGFAQCARAFLSNLESTGAPNFALLEPQNNTHALALRLLCEAWQIVNIERKSDCSGIPIHAPSTIDEWLAPFGQGSTPGSLVALLGEARSEATALFNAIMKPQEHSLKDAVSTFLAAKLSKQ